MWSRLSLADSYLDDRTGDAFCASSQDELSRWNGVGISTPVVHWAACGDWDRMEGLRSLRELHGWPPPEIE